MIYQHEIFFTVRVLCESLQHRAVRCSVIYNCWSAQRLSTFSCIFRTERFDNVNHVTHHSSVYCTILDATKAFDRVKYTKLFRLLIAWCLPPVVLRVLLFMYTHSTARLSWNGCLSRFYCVLNGIKQAALFFVVAALRSRCRHYIFILWFLSSIFFSPRLTSVVADWIFTVLLHMVWP